MHVDFVSPLSHNSSGTCITMYVCIHCADHLHTLHTLVLGPHHAVKDFVQSVLEEKKPYKRKLEFSQHPDQLFYQNKTKKRKLLAGGNRVALVRNQMFV